ncbi:hypothetical protein ACNRD9_22775, partial [Ralstonia pseudosolanacearum]
LAVGALLLLAGFAVTWAIFFSQNSATKAKVLECVNTPLVRGPRIPTWFFWAAITLIVGILAYAFTLKDQAN